MGNGNFSDKTGGMHSEGSSAKADRQLIAALPDGWATGEDQNRPEGNHPSEVASLSPARRALEPGVINHLPCSLQQLPH